MLRVMSRDLQIFQNTDTQKFTEKLHENLQGNGQVSLWRLYKIVKRPLGQNRAATFASQNDVKLCHHNFRGAKHIEISMA